MGGVQIFFAVASERLQRTLAFYLTQEEAQAALLSVIEDEPELARDLSVVSIDFSGAPLVETLS